jgi:hypothetical protein
MTLRLAAAVSMASGFIALSYEILWVRVYDFMNEGEPQAFGFLLSAYLAGLALGALHARRYCGGHDAAGRAASVAALVPLLIMANVVAFATVPTWLPWHPGRSRRHKRFPIFALAAGLLGTTFPLVAHSAILPDERTGGRVAQLYLANIAGSTAGSLLTGFVLLDLWPL